MKLKQQYKDGNIVLVIETAEGNIDVAADA